MSTRNEPGHHRGELLSANVLLTMSARGGCYMAIDIQQLTTRSGSPLHGRGHWFNLSVHGSSEPDCDSGKRACRRLGWGACSPPCSPFSSLRRRLRHTGRGMPRRPSASTSPQVERPRRAFAGVRTLVGGAPPGVEEGAPDKASEKSHCPRRVQPADQRCGEPDGELDRGECSPANALNYTQLHRL